MYSLTDGMWTLFALLQHFAKVLSQRAVAYLNADVILQGMDHMRFRASPMLHNAVINAAKKVK